MPEHVFLSESEPLLIKTARWLAGQATSRPLDLTTCQVVLPTAGAARRLRAQLLCSHAGAGLLPPPLTTPMGLLTLHDGPEVASRSDSLRAWVHVIARATPEKFPQLLAGFSDLSASAFRIAGSLADVCGVLAEAGMTPSSSEILRACPLEEDRWREIESLYRRYLKHLQGVGLRDANVAHLTTAEAGTALPGMTRIVVAGVTDLNPLLVRYLTALPLPVTLLIEAAGCDDEAKFDAWGRPDPEFWTQQILPPLAPVFLADPGSESRAVAELLGPAALCVADPALVPYFQRTLTSDGRQAFDPGGTPLARFEVAALARLWIGFCRTGRLATFRALLEHPAGRDAFCQDADLGFEEALAALDNLTTKRLVASFPEALAGIRRMKKSSPEVRLLTTAKHWRARFDITPGLPVLADFLEHVYGDREVRAGSPEAAALNALGTLLRAASASLLGGSVAEEELFAAEIAAAPVYESHPEGALELHGWLEAPWLPHEALVVSGCTEGALPAQVSSHPFLPDSLRVALGLTGNAGRLARDIHQLHGLLAARPEGRVQLTLSRTGPDGDPLRPSRLLFRCPDSELPARVQQLFGSPLSLRETFARPSVMPLRVPEMPPPQRLSVTAFGDYLHCPMRFYFNRVLRMEPFDPLKSELDALEFGEILHRAIETFSRDPAVCDSTDVGMITRYVLEALDRDLRDVFGSGLSLPVRVQRESLRARLRQFAAIQARERADGWRIVEAELAFSLDDTLLLGGLPLTGKIDRIEIHQDTGQRRILDYKTYKSIEKNLPTDTHFAFLAEPEEDFPEAEFLRDGKLRRWTQLQLPLYRALAEFRWPKDPLPVRTGYFLLPEKIEESGIHEFPADEDLFDSAMICADSVADRVRRGVFWPPRSPKYENYAGLFLGRPPEDVLDSASRLFLQAQ
jgi:ATP-dependent helicase/nuclease subunit B